MSDGGNDNGRPSTIPGGGSIVCGFVLALVRAEDGVVSVAAMQIEGMRPAVQSEQAMMARELVAGLDIERLAIRTAARAVGNAPSIAVPRVSAASLGLAKARR